MPLALAADESSMIPIYVNVLDVSNVSSIQESWIASRKLTDVSLSC